MVRLSESEGGQINDVISDTLPKPQENLQGRGEHQPMFAGGREYVRHEPIQGLKIQGTALGDVLQQVSLPLLILIVFGVCNLGGGEEACIESVNRRAGVEWRDCQSVRGFTCGERKRREE